MNGEAPRNVSWKKIVVCGCAAVLSLSSPEASFAQEGTGESAKEKADAATVPIEELGALEIEELAQVRVTSIATGTRKPVTEAPAFATVLTARDIQAMGATTLEEALIAVPGLHVSWSGQGSPPRYFIRGITNLFNPQTLVMINGIPITSMVRGERNARLGVLPVKFISRIEVIRGPGSALYGADAFAGVINVVTKNEADIRGTESGGQAGSFDTYEAWLLHGENEGPLKASIMLDYRETGGHRRIITEDAQTAFDRSFGTQASLAPGPMNLMGKWFGAVAEVEKSKVRLRGSHYTTWGLGTGQGIGQSLDPNGRLIRSRSLVDLAFHDPEFRRDWELSSLLAFHHGAQQVERDLYIAPVGANLGQGVLTNGGIGKPEFWERQGRLDLSAIYKGFADHRLRMGVGAKYVEVYRVRQAQNFSSNFAPRPDLVDLTDTPETYLPEKSRANFFVFAQDEWGFARDWELTIGARHDHYSDFGGTFNPRAALVWRTTPRLTSKILYGRAFRAPHFGELYSINNPVSIGNPNVEPEVIDVYELGWYFHHADAWSTGLNLFYYKVKDRIEFVRDPAGTATAQNSGGQDGYGLEFETKLKATRSLIFTGNYSYAETIDETTDKSVGEYPTHRVYIRDDWTFWPNWTWSNQINWVGDRNRIPSDPRPRLKGYATTDVILRRSALGKFGLTASVRNLFDVDAREPSAGPGPTGGAAAIPNDLPLAGRSFFGELSYHF